jgi:hypothetical protein
VGGVSGYTRTDYNGVKLGIDPMEEVARFIIYLRDLPAMRQKNGKPPELLRGKTIRDYVGSTMKEMELLSGERMQWTPVAKGLMAWLRSEPRSPRFKDPAPALLVAKLVTNMKVSLAIRTVVMLAWQFTWRLGQATSQKTTEYNLHRQIRRNDVHFEIVDGERVSVRIKCRGAKNDKFNSGSVKWLVLAADDFLCPVKMFCEYWDSTLDHEMDGPLFRHASGHLVTQRQVVTQIKRTAEEMGLNPDWFAGHSLRIGGATKMTAADLSIFDRMQQGGWSTVEGMLGYMRASEEQELRVRNALALQHPEIMEQQQLRRECTSSLYSRPRFDDRRR